MGALSSGPGALWPWLGVLAWGLVAGLPLAGESGLRWPWPLMLGVPLGVLLYALALVPALALSPPPVAVAVAAVAGLLPLAALAAHRAFWPGGTAASREPVGHRPAPGERGRHGSRALAVPSGAAVDWLACGALAAMAGGVAVGGARYARAALLAAELPPLLYGPSTGDWGLHALRVALLAREGIPPPSPLDPDYPLQYRYLFHVLAAAFAVGRPADVALVASAVSGLVLGALVLAGSTLAYSLTRAWPAALGAGLLAALYGPSYWLPEAVRLVAAGRLPGVSALGAVAGERWPLSPLSPSFPSMFTAQGSSPGLPVGLLAWLVVLISLAAVARPASPGRGLVAATVAGLSLACLAFAADFFLPLAGAGMVAGWLLTPKRRDTAWGRRLGRPLLAGGVGLVLGLALLFGGARQLGGAGTAQGLHLVWNETLGRTPVYGGNHALLTGGQAVPFPNWVAVHDWGVLFWPGLAVVLAGAWRRRDAVLLTGGVTVLLAALFWQLGTVAYESQVSVDLRVQMYRFASMATAALAPLLPVGLQLSFAARPGESRSWPPGRPGRWRIGLLHLPLAVVGGGAGLYFLAALGTLQPAPPPEWAGDVALARVLAGERGASRLAVLNGPATFLEMYNAGPGGYVPIWWGWGAAAVPVGWDFGHPERYGLPYRRVVQEYAPGAAADLRLTHVAVAPSQVPVPDRAAVAAFLSRCDAILLGTYGDATQSAARRLYRIRPEACAGH